MIYAIYKDPPLALSISYTCRIKRDKIYAHIPYLRILMISFTHRETSTIAQPKLLGSFLQIVHPSCSGLLSRPQLFHGLQVFLPSPMSIRSVVPAAVCLVQGNIVIARNDDFQLRINFFESFQHLFIFYEVARHSKIPSVKKNVRPGEGLAVGMSCFGRRIGDPCMRVGQEKKAGFDGLFRLDGTGTDGVACGHRGRYEGAERRIGARPRSWSDRLINESSKCRFEMAYKKPPEGSRGIEVYDLQVWA